MNRNTLKTWGIAILLLISNTVWGQMTDENFKSFQLSMPRVQQAISAKEDKLKKEFAEKKLAFPANEVYIRSFKAQNEMEIWVRNPGADTFTFFKKYNICALSGSLGPKRWEGDRQVPEGFYFINHFNPRSDFHLSMLVSYPNYSDLILGNKQKPGGDIYIHGACYTVGCLPMTDDIIKEIYVLCLQARFNGQQNIPIHIFPTRFSRSAVGFLAKEYGEDEKRQRFWLNLKAGYDYFEKNKTLMPVMYNKEGKYVF